MTLSNSNLVMCPSVVGGGLSYRRVGATPLFSIVNTCMACPGTIWPGGMSGSPPCCWYAYYLVQLSRHSHGLRLNFATTTAVEVIARCLSPVVETYNMLVAERSVERCMKS